MATTYFAPGRVSVRGIIFRLHSVLLASRVTTCSIYKNKKESNMLASY